MSKNFTFSALLTVLALSANAQEKVNIEDVLRYGNYDVAKTYYHQLLKKEPDQGTHYYDLGRIHLAQQQNDSAEIYFKNGLRVDRNPDINNLGIAHLSLNTGNEKEALSKLNTLAAKQKKIPAELLLQMANVLIHSKNPNIEKAIVAAKDAQKANPKSVDGILVEGDAYLKEGSKKLAEQKYKEAIKKDDQSVEAKLRLAKIYKMENSFDKAIELYNEALAINSEFPATYRDLALTYQDYATFSKNSSLNKKAVDNYKKFHKLIGQSHDNDNQYGDFLVKIQDYSALTDFVQDVWVKRGDIFQIYRYAAISAFEQGSFENAYMFITKYFDVQDVPSKITAVDHFYLGISQVMRSVSGKEVNENEFKTGIANMEKGISLDPSLANDINKKALTVFKKENYKQAYFLFDLGTKNESVTDFVSNLYYKGTCLYLTQEKPIIANPLEKAIQSYDQAVALAPNTHEAFLMNARANRNLNTEVSKSKMVQNYEGFIKALGNKGMLNEKEFQPALLEAYMMMGDFYKTNDKAKAIVSFENALRVDPTHEYSKLSLQKLK